jgi:hypothetical protein
MANFLFLHEIGTEELGTRAVLVNLDLVKRIRPPKISLGYVELTFIDDPSYLLLVEESFDDVTQMLEAVGARSRTGADTGRGRGL